MKKIEEIKKELNENKILLNEKNAEYNELLTTIRNLEEEIKNSKDVVQTKRTRYAMIYQIVIWGLVLLQMLLPQFSRVFAVVGMPIIITIYLRAQHKNRQIIPDLQKKLDEAKKEQTSLFDVVNQLRSLVHNLDKELEDAMYSVDYIVPQIATKVEEIESVVEYDNGQKLVLDFKSC